MTTLTIRKSPLFRFIAFMVLVAFAMMLPVQPSWAQVAIVMPPPGQMIHVTHHFEPPQMVGLKVDLKDPFSFNFIMDQGEKPMSDADQQQEFNKIIKYFLVSLAMPNKDMWVNLSPYESNRIIPEIFAQTEMGRDLLAQDYILKQFTASLMYPEDGLGKTFWNKVYSQAQARFGTTEINVNTFNKVWIVADKADIYQKGDTAFLVGSHLKVMLEQDYMAIEKNKAQFGNAQALQEQGKDAKTKMASDIVREIIIPAIEKEVNDGKSFAAVRQVYNAEIMATWFKKTLRESLLGQVFADKSKVAGQKVDDPQAKEKIYKQYLRAYKKGVFNYIKEDATPDGQMIPRKYFSGGMQGVPNAAMTVFGPEIFTIWGKNGAGRYSDKVREVKSFVAGFRNTARFLTALVALGALSPNAHASVALFGHKAQTNAPTTTVVPQQPASFKYALGKTIFVDPDTHKVTSSQEGEVLRVGFNNYTWKAGKWQDKNGKEVIIKHSLLGLSVAHVRTSSTPATDHGGFTAAGHELDRQINTISGHISKGFTFLERHFSKKAAAAPAAPAAAKPAVPAPAAGTPAGVNSNGLLPSGVTTPELPAAAKVGPTNLPTAANTSTGPSATAVAPALATPDAIAKAQQQAEQLLTKANEQIAAANAAAQQQATDLEKEKQDIAAEKARVAAELAQVEKEKARLSAQAANASPQQQEALNNLNKKADALAVMNQDLILHEKEAVTASQVIQANLTQAKQKITNLEGYLNDANGTAEIHNVVFYGLLIIAFLGSTLLYVSKRRALQSKNAELADTQKALADSQALAASLEEALNQARAVGRPAEEISTLEGALGEAQGAQEQAKGAQEEAANNVPLEVKEDKVVVETPGAESAVSLIDLKSQLAAAEGKLGQQIQALEQAKAELQKAKDDAVAKRTQAAETKKGQFGLFGDAMSRIKAAEALNKEAEALEAEQSKLQITVDSFIAEVAVLQQQVKDLKVAIQKHIAEAPEGSHGSVVRLSNQVADIKAQLAQEIQALAQAKAAVAPTEAALKIEEENRSNGVVGYDQNGQLRNNKLDRDKEIERLKAEQADKQAKIAEINQRVIDLEQKINVLGGQVNKIIAGAALGTHAYAIRLTNQLADVQAQLKRQRPVLEQAKVALAPTEAALKLEEENRANGVVGYDKNGQLRNNKLERDAEIERLKADQTDKQAKIAEINQGVVDLEGKVNNLKEEIEANNKLVEQKANEIKQKIVEAQQQEQDVLKAAQAHSIEFFTNLRKTSGQLEEQIKAIAGVIKGKGPKDDLSIESIEGIVRDDYNKAKEEEAKFNAQGMYSDTNPEVEALFSGENGLDGKLVFLVANPEKLLVEAEQEALVKAREARVNLRGDLNKELSRISTEKASLDQLVALVNSSAANSDLGGINLSDEHQIINIKVDGAGMPLPPKYQDAAMLNLDGLTSIIRKISPVTMENVPALYELVGQSQ